MVTHELFASFPTISSSIAHDMGYRALADVTRVAESNQLDYRVVGGLAVSLLVAAYQVTDVPERATADADIAASIEVLRRPELTAGLRDAGYCPRDGSRWFRTLTKEERFEYVAGTTTTDDLDALELVVDFMGPSLGGRHEASVPAGELNVDGFPGVSLALARDPVIVAVSPRLTTGKELTLNLRLPSPGSLLVIKLLAWRDRLARKDVIDIWRLLGTCRCAGIGPNSWWSGGAQGDALRQLELMVSPTSTILNRAQLDAREQAAFRALSLHVVGELPRS